LGWPKFASTNAKRYIGKDIGSQGCLLLNPIQSSKTGRKFFRIWPNKTGDNPKMDAACFKEKVGFDFRMDRRY